MNVKILEPAEKDIENGYYFYENQKKGLGTYFLNSIYTDIDSLTIYAGIHFKVFKYFRLLSKRFPFAIYYKKENNIVLVTAVLDCRRNPSWIHDKLMNE